MTPKRSGLINHPVQPKVRSEAGDGFDTGEGPNSATGAGEEGGIDDLPDLIAFDDIFSQDAAPRIGNVTFSTWNDVNMSVQDGLAGCRDIVDADVEPVRLQPAQQPDTN